MNDSLQIAVYVLAAFGVFYLVTRVLHLILNFWLIGKIKKAIDENGGVEKIIREHLIVLDVELDNGTYFCYNNEDKQFVCQGKSYKDIKEAIEKTSPEKLIVLSDKTPKDILEKLQAEKETYYKEGVV